MGTGKQRISTAARLEAKAEGEPVLELELVQVAPELERVQVAPELERDREAAELVIGPAAVPELETVPVVALELVIGPAVVRELELVLVVVLEPNHRRAQPAVALRTKSVTTAHRPDLVPLLEAEEDLAAAVAETTREPAAAEAAIAWAAEE
jgi:hypothetical protein